MNPSTEDLVWSALKLPRIDQVGPGRRSRDKKKDKAPPGRTRKKEGESDKGHKNGQGKLCDRYV